jgi:hypothetical protein
MATAAERFARLSTPAKLLLILTAALLPIGFGLGWVAYQGIHEANAALQAQSNDKARTAARAIESLVARNALALRIASNGRMDGPDPANVFAVRFRSRLPSSSNSGSRPPTRTSCAASAISAKPASSLQLRPATFAFGLLPMRIRSSSR